MTSTTFASLSVPSMEDSMEVSSSPAGNEFDGDIDIDFGDYGAVTHLTDDERMLEDAEPNRPATATDELMDDDDQTLNAPIIEEIMQDGPESEQQQQQEVADEELIDYDDDDAFQDHAQSIFDDTAVPKAENSLVADTGGFPEPDHVDNAVVHKAGQGAIAEQPSITLTEAAVQPVNDDGTEDTDTAKPSQSIDTGEKSNAREPFEAQEEAQAEDATNAGQGETEETTFTQALADVEEQGNENTEAIKTPPQLPNSVNTSIGYAADGPPTPTDTGLHPVIVKFEGYEMPLFKSHAQPDGLLKDDNLASVSLAALLQDCRQRLATKTDTPVTDEQELCLGFDHLGLALSESSRSASGTSLNDILEVYLQLHENDGAEDIPPVSLSLTRQLKFDTSFNILKQAALQGQGMSTFSFLGSDHHDEIYEEDGTAENSAGEPERQDEQTDGVDGTQDQDFAQGHESNEYEDQEDQNNQDVGAYDQDGEYPEGQYGENDQNEEYPDPEDYDPESGITAVHDHEGQEYHTEAVDPTGGSAPEAFEDAEEVVALESAASSATARNDELANDGTEAYADDGDEDFSTLLTEYDADATQDGAEAQALVEGTTGSSDATHTDQFGLVNDHDGATAADLGSEDLLHYDHPDGEGDGEGVEYYNEEGQDLDQYEEKDYNQADNLVYDNEGDPQPGEDDEQFHTAFDLLDDDHHEDPKQNPDITEPDQAYFNGTEVNEDDIGFDDDVDFGDNQSTAPAVSSNSPLGKRSYEEHVDDEEFDFGEPDVKKARSG